VKAPHPGYPVVLLIVYLCSLCVPAAAQPANGNGKQPLTRIAFGSCLDQKRPKGLLNTIADDQPQLFIWLGDNVYVKQVSELPAAYKALAESPEFIRLQQTCPMVATWDDNDYGKGDGGVEHAEKELSKQYFLSAFPSAATTEAKGRPGVYNAYTYGPRGKRVKVIMLDARWFRDAQVPDPFFVKRYVASPTGDMLGEAQWQWLRKELRTDDAQLTLIGSGVQVLPEEHGFEKWANLTQARARLVREIADSGSPNVIFMSGDRHISEVSKLDTTAMNYNLYDITSSGLTHVYEGLKTEPNRLRVGELIKKISYCMLLVDWQNKQPIVTVQFKGMDGAVLQSMVLDLAARKRR